jgi:hypothetical protein
MRNFFIWGGGGWKCVSSAQDTGNRSYNSYCIGRVLIYRNGKFILRFWKYNLVQIFTINLRSRTVFLNLCETAAR